MSTCTFFWTSLHKSVELDPVCPSLSAASYTEASGGNMYTVEPSDAGPDGLNLVDFDKDITTSNGTVGWLDLNTVSPHTGLYLTTGGFIF